MTNPNWPPKPKPKRSPINWDLINFNIGEGLWLAFCVFLFLLGFFLTLETTSPFKPLVSEYTSWISLREDRLLSDEEIDKILAEEGLHVLMQRHPELFDWTATHVITQEDLQQ